MPKRHAKFRLRQCAAPSSAFGIVRAIRRIAKRRVYTKQYLMNKAVTVLHCDRFCIIIANCPSPHTTHFKNRAIPCHALYSWLPCQRELDCDKATSYYKLQHFAILSTLIFAQPLSVARLRDCSPSAPSIRFSALSFSTLPNTKIRHLSKQRILYIQFSALVKMVSGSKATML